MAALVLSLPAAALAQSSDKDYCAALSATYDKYLQLTGSRGSQQPPMANVEQAKAKCRTDPASAIPVLEKVLKDNKFELPKRG